MPTHESFVCIDVPPSNGERAAAAMALANRLREELLGESPREALVNRPPVYRLVHHLGSCRPRGNGSAPPVGASAHEDHAKHDEPRREHPNRYIVLAEEDVKRLQRLAHLLSSVSGELNLWLAGMQHGDEEVEL